MATKLEGLHIKKVDFVDQGANQMANIKIKKSKDGEEIPNPEIGLFKRFVNWITGELSKPGSEITKSATTFNEQINAVSMDAIRDEIWSTCYALQNSLNSILCDAEMDSSAKQAAMALAYYQNASNYFAKALFPTCPVGLSSDNYYIFSREDLLRDNWQRKPAYGKVDPTVVGESTDNYVCKVDQMIMGIDQIRQTDLSRRQGPSIIQPKQQRTRTIAEQANIHQDRLFAASYFKEGAWKNELEGVDNTTPSTNQFIKFSNANSDPIAFIDKEKTDMNQQTGRMPNRLGLGINVFNALKVHPGILERVKYGGSTANPASVTENVLAQLFGVEKIVVLKSIMNSASMGADEDMQYIGDPNAFLLAYATNAPSVDEPSAGYIFTWDMLGNGQMLPILNYLGENGTHTEYIEGLMATDMKKTSDDLARFC